MVYRDDVMSGNMAIFNMVILFYIFLYNEISLALFPHTKKLNSNNLNFVSCHFCPDVFNQVALFNQKIKFMEVLVLQR